MRTAALFATVALISMPSTFAAPTPRSEPEPIVVLPEDSPCRGTAIPLGRRAVASDLTRADGTVDLNKAHVRSVGLPPRSEMSCAATKLTIHSRQIAPQLQIARARAKFTRGLANFRSNMGEAHFLSPDLVDPSLLPGSPSFPAESSSSSSGAADTDVPVSAPAVKRRRDKIFGESGIRLHGVPPSASTPPSSNGSFANRRALERRAVPNPKVIPNPKWTGSTAAGNSAKTGNVGLTNYGEGTIFYGSLKIGSSAQSFSVNIDTGCVLSLHRVRNCFVLTRASPATARPTYGFLRRLATRPRAMRTRNTTLRRVRLLRSFQAGSSTSSTETGARLRASSTPTRSPLAV